QPDGGDGPAGQIDKSREQHHRGADRPDDLRDHEVEMEVEAPANAYQRELEQDEPEPAAGEKTADVADAAAARAIEKGGYAGQKDERRCAKMRDPPSEKQGRIREVARIDAAGAEEIAGVVERHQHHDQPPQQVDAVEAPARACVE